MGLDQFLERCDRKAYGYKNFNIDEIKENNVKLYNEIKPFLVNRGEHIHWESIFSPVGYWRKANAVHRWFVENVQDGEDDCGTYEVNKEQLEELLSICELIKDKCKLVKGKVNNGQYFENGKWVTEYVDGQVLDNQDIAEAYLPTQSGFFFGCTDYDEYYLDDINDTIDILTNALETTDFDTQMIVYSSSW